MKDLSFNFKGLAAKARQNIGLTLWAVLLVLVLLEALVVRQSISVLLAARQVEPSAKTQLVRVNFALYDTIVKRLGQQNSFTPTPVTAKNPFGTLDSTPTK